MLKFYLYNRLKSPNYHKNIAIAKEAEMTDAEDFVVQAILTARHIKNSTSI